MQVGRPVVGNPGASEDAPRMTTIKQRRETSSQDGSLVLLTERATKPDHCFQ